MRKDSDAVNTSEVRAGLGMPPDSRYLLRDVQAREQEDDVKLAGVLKVAQVQRGMAIALPLSLLLLGLDAVQLGFFVPAPVPALGPLLILVLATGLLVTGLLGRRLLISRRHVVRWRLVLVLLTMPLGFVWAGLQITALAGAAPSPGLFLLASVGVAASFAQAVFWWPATLAVGSGYLAGMLVAGVVLDLEAMRLVWPLTVLGGVAVPLAVAGYLGVRGQGMLAEVGRLQGALARLHRDLSDNEQRIAHEREQRQGAEQELIVVREMADSASQAKTEFLATMSHEIRTPLNGILPILDMLRDTPLNGEQARLVHTAHNSSRHLLRIINDILDFAKAESGKLQLESIEIDLRDLVGAVTDLLRQGAQRKGLRLSSKVATDVPALVRGDPIRLRQILINLVSNAVKFTDQGRIVIELSRRRVSRKEVELLFEVRDTGIGMSRTAARGLFQSFQQADASTTRKHGGTGLGLAICKRLVHLMGGKIAVRSRLGEGSVFSFVLPMRKSVRDVPTARKNLVGVRLLSLIREGATAHALAEHLLAWGVVEERASSPEDALDKLRASAMLGSSWIYDLLLIDANGMEGSVLPLVREVMAGDGPGDTRVMALVRSESLARQLREDFGVFVLGESIQPEPLRGALYRLLDVEGSDNAPPPEGLETDFLDMNMEAPDDLDSEPPAEPNVAPLVPLHGHVLVVEDNRINLTVVRKVLTRLGLESTAAEDGRVAVRAFAARRPDLVLMDCQMPGMDGFQATAEIRASEGIGQHVPIIALTANAMAGDKEKCLAAGMDDYLSKPVSLSELQQAVQKWLDGGRGKVAEVAVTAVGVEPAVEDADPVLDLNQLAELREVMQDEFGGLVQSYLESAPAALVQLADAARARDLAALCSGAHSFKSSSANVGARRLAERARRVEHAARSGNLDEALAAAAGLDSMFREAATALAPHLAASQT